MEASVKEKGGSELISVIIPGHNCESTLVRCLQSVTRQTCKKFEAIYVDDGSTDHSLEIAEKFSEDDSRIRVVSKLQGGVSSARNVGMKLTTQSDYTCFLDSDDWLETNALSELCKYISSSKFDFLFFDWNEHVQSRSRDDVTRVSLLDQGLVGADVSVEKLQNHYFRSRRGGAPWAKVYRTNIIRQQGLKFDETLDYAEDYVFNLSYLRFATRIIYLPKALYNYDIVKENSNNKYSDNYFDRFLQIDGIVTALYPEMSVLQYSFLTALRLEQIANSMIALCRSEAVKNRHFWMEWTRIRAYFKTLEVSPFDLIHIRLSGRIKILLSLMYFPICIKDS